MSARYLLALPGLALAALAAPAAAQFSTGPAPKVLEVTPYVGYMAFGKFLDGPLGTNIGMNNGLLYGTQLGVSLTPNVALVGNIAYASSDLKIGVPIIGGINVGTSSALLYDGGVQLSMSPSPTSPIRPFVQAGAGAIHYNVSNRLLDANSTNVAYNVGGGLTYRISPTVGVRGMVIDYIGKFDFKDATSFDFQGKTANNVALSLGLTIGF